MFRLENFLVLIPRVSEAVEQVIYVVTRKASSVKYSSHNDDFVRKSDEIGQCSGLSIKAPFNGRIHSFGTNSYLGNPGPTPTTWHDRPAATPQEKYNIDVMTFARIQPEVDSDIHYSGYWAYPEIFAQFENGLSKQDKKILKMWGWTKDEITQRSEIIVRDLSNLRTAVTRKEPLPPSP